MSLSQPVAGSPEDQAPRFTLRTAALMLIAAAATFLVAYAVGGVFGRAADTKLGAAEAHTMPALAPAGTPDVTLRAQYLAFDAATITLPAGRSAVIRLENEDAGILHSIAVYRDTRATDLVARGALFDGPRTRDYHVAPLPAGTYYFQCDLHPAMNGTLEAVDRSGQ
jgi:plastocyanin